MGMKTATCDEKTNLEKGRGSERDGGEMGEEEENYSCITLG